MTMSFNYIFVRHFRAVVFNPDDYLKSPPDDFSPSNQTPLPNSVDQDDDIDFDCENSNIEIPSHDEEEDD